MITIYSLKPRFQRALEPLSGFLARMGVTPNQVTLFTTFFSVGFGVYFIEAGRASWWSMPLVFLIRMALNAVDGMLARKLEMQSRLGVYLNELGDLISDLMLYLPLALAFPVTMGTVLALSLISEVAGILAVAVGEARRYDGPMGKSDRAFCLGVIGFLMAFDLLSGIWAEAVFCALALLLCLTIFLRIKNGLGQK